MLQHRSLLPIAAGLAALASSAAAQALQPQQLPGPYPQALNGDAAIQSLGNDAALIAARNGMTSAELIELLRRDADAWLSNGRVMYIDTAVPAVPEEPPPLQRAGVQRALTEEEVFKLHSRPGLERVIYLDYNGHHSQNNGWGHNIMFPAYDTNNDPTTFSAGELLSIEDQFYRVAEDFAPFDVDVTTEEPPPGGLSKNGAADTTWGGRCVMTQATSGFGNGIGGVAFLNSFASSNASPCFAFNKGTNNASMTASHEVGHMLGLSHDGLNNQEYHPGVGGSGVTSWGPIMGAPFGKSLVQWSAGQYTGATTTQNDYNIITKAANGTPWRTDDFTDLIPAENALSFQCPDLSTTSVMGLIGMPTDTDTFSFHTRGGPVTIQADPLLGGANLDILLELYDEAGVLLTSINDVGLIDATIEMTVPEGNYTVRIDGTERPGRYTDYGSLGQYTIHVTVPLWESLAAGSGIPPLLAGTGSACAAEPIDIAITGAKPDSVAFLVFGAGEFRQPFMGGVLVPDISREGDIWTLPVDGGGNAGFVHPWPAGVISGTRLVFQAWVFDPRIHVNFSSSNAIATTAP